MAFSSLYPHLEIVYVARFRINNVNRFKILHVSATLLKIDYMYIIEKRNSV